MNTTNTAHNTFKQKPFRGFLTQLLSEAFYTEELIPVPMTEPDHISIYDYEDPCDQQQFLRRFLNKSV